MFYAAWMKRGFKFEENGTYTSTTFRGLFNRFKPTKKQDKRFTDEDLV